MNTIVVFILGMLSVIVCAVMVLGVIAFFKVIKLKIKLEETISHSSQSFNDSHNNLCNIEEGLNKKIEEYYEEVYKSMDSRFNKIENKFDLKIKSTEK